MASAAALMLSVMTCAVCGRPLPDDARFCLGCGAAVDELPRHRRAQGGDGSLRRSRRLHGARAAARRRARPRGARAVLRRGHPGAAEPARAAGEVHRRCGDGGLRPAPGARGRRPRAVRAGLAIRARAQRLREELGSPTSSRCAMGIESGEAATGSGPSEQLLVTGSVVNAAARLQAAAAPGEVLVGDTAHALTRVGRVVRRSPRGRGEGVRQPLSSSRCWACRRGRSGARSRSSDATSS